MPDTGLVAQVDRIDRMEEDTKKAQVQMARVLYLTRELAGLSLRDVAPKVGMTAAQISNIERGKSWKTKTVRRIARFYDSLSSAA